VVLAEAETSARLGEITLEPHQQSAVARMEAALEEFGGALLSDDVGMGKTFVAAAIARRYAHTLVVAPAGLKSMWHDALTMTRTTADIVTFERLSRGGGLPGSHAEYDLVIVDEAHHARNPATRRYDRLAALARGARVLLVTATPIHNRRREMIALLSLFLGSRASALNDSEFARCVVRRDRRVLVRGAAIPEIAPLVHRMVSDNPAIVEEIMALPAPIPPRDGGVAGALIGRGLVHQWASSEAALCEAIRRRIAKAAALSASLESGNYPTAREMETWVYGDGALQLGFPELLSSPADDAPALLDSVRSHSAALQRFHARHRTDEALDQQRADILLQIRTAHPGARIVAFGQYAATISTLFRRLSAGGRVAMLTAKGGLVAGGKLSRDEVLTRFAPRALRAGAPSPAEKIDLLLATDLLSEGVNLQDAQVVIHLDVPWTSARMEQRVGRIARMGSLHSLVSVYLLHPPASAELLLGSESLVQAKWDAAKRSIGSSAAAPFARQSSPREFSVLESIPAKAERVRRILESWRRPDCPSQSPDTIVATVLAPGRGFVAAVSVGGEPQLLTSMAGCISTDVDSQIAGCSRCDGDHLDTRIEDCDAALGAIHEWFAHDLASATAGVAGSKSRARRRLLGRIDALVQNAPPHLRVTRSRTASRARSVATEQLGAALESDLALLACSELPDDSWLESIAELDSMGSVNKKPARQTATLRIHALLLTRETA
jgi:superfamily II DNA or RNA helicase